MRSKTTAKAFTLVELLTVLAIIATLLTIGIGGLMTLRRSVSLNTITNEFVTLMNTLQSRARNGAVSEMRFISTGSIPQSRIDAIAISFLDYTFRYCFSSSSAGSITYNCSGQEAPVSAAFSIPTDSYILPGTCRIIVFARLTGKISGLNNYTGAPIDTGSCQLTTMNFYSGETREILIDFTNNNITVL